MVDFLNPAEHSTRRVLIVSPADVATALGKLARVGVPDVIVLWDPELGEIPSGAVERFAGSLDDAWTPGAKLSGSDAPDLLRFTEPLHVYRPVPAPNVDGAVSWRLDPRATFLRGATLRTLGGPDPGFTSIAGALHEMGYRWLRRGAILRQRPDVFPAGEPLAIPLADRYRELVLHHSRKWARYACARRLLGGAHPIAEIRALQVAMSDRSSSAHPVPIGATQRDVASQQLPSRPTVSVVLPTFGRYRYVAEVLADLRSQTVPPSQILIADGNPVELREPAVYQQFADLPIEVLWIEKTGTCVSRNECLARADGDYLWFVDDDSRLAADNLEQHLRVLAAYGADVSVGPAYTRQRPELHADQQEVRCTFMDCGTTLVRRDMLARVGGFDMQFNDRLAGEDGELGVRFVRAGGLMVSNPHAKRFHYLAPVGGARASANNLHRWRRWSFRPRPVQSIYYTGTRHFDAHATREAVFQMWLLVGWRRADGVRATLRWKAQTLAAEVLALPISLLRLARSVAIGKRMASEGPQIPKLWEP